MTPTSMHHFARTGRQPARGFTLIELMIACAIVALLASLAYPAYTNSVQKGRRAEARASLLNLMQAQERYMTQNGTYLAFALGATGNAGTNAAGSTSVTIPFRTVSGDGNTGSAAYRLGAAACTQGSTTLALNECVELSAEPRRTDSDAGTLTLRSTGARGCSGTKSAVAGVCW